MRYELYNRLLEFDHDLGIPYCEKIVEEISERIPGFTYKEVEEVYYREDKEYEIHVWYRVENDGQEQQMVDYLRSCGLNEKYIIYHGND